MESTLEQDRERTVLLEVARNAEVQDFLRNGVARQIMGLTNVPPLVFNQQAGTWTTESTQQHVDRELIRRRESLPAETLDKIWEEAREPRQRLTECLNAYRAVSKQEGRKSEVNIDLESATWQSLREFVVHVEEAKDQYGGKSNHKLSKARQGFRAFSDRAASAKCFTALLPTQSNYGSLLFGSSVVILEAAHQLSLTRKGIIEALEAIPEILEETKNAVSLYRYDERMHTACAKVYVAVLHAYIFIIEWFRQTALKKSFKALLGQKRYSEDGIHELVRHIGARYNELQTRAEIIHQQQQHYTMELVEDLHARGDASQAAAVNVMNQVSLSLHIHVHDGLKGEEPKKKLEASRTTHRRDRLSGSIISKALGINEVVAYEDCIQALNTADSLGPREQLKIAKMLTEERLIKWLRNGESDVLLVNGHLEHLSRSSISVLSAKIVEALEIGSESTGREIIPLMWFCGQHDILGGEDSHPQGMALHLLVQLAMVQSNLECDCVTAFWEKMEPTNVDSIMDVLESLVVQLPYTTQICFILDGICSYEDSDRRDDLLKLIDRLLKIEGNDGGSTTKILMTSVQSTNYVYKSLDGKEEILDVY